MPLIAVSLVKNCTRLLAFGLAASLMAGCVSYEPRTLIPAITLSPEDITLGNATAGAAGQISFGLEATVNESDSLFNVTVLPGIRVRAVDANGPASSAGIQAGDVILKIDDIETNQPDVLTTLQQQSVKASPYLFTVRRNTVVFEATVVPAAVSSVAAPQELYRADPLATRAGYRTELLSIRNQPAVAAAQIVELFPESPLPEAGINEGDFILALNGTNLNSAQGLISRLNQEFALGDEVVLTVYDGDTVNNREVRLWNPGRRISRVTLGPLLHYESSLNPSSDRLTVLDLWLFAFYRYSRVDGEKTHSVLGLFNYSSNYGELTEEAN